MLWYSEICSSLAHPKNAVSLILLCNTGKALKGKRSQVQLCTKFGIKFTKEGGMACDGSRIC